MLVCYNVTPPPPPPLLPPPLLSSSHPPPSRRVPLSPDCRSYSGLLDIRTRIPVIPAIPQKLTRILSRVRPATPPPRLMYVPPVGWISLLPPPRNGREGAGGGGAERRHGAPGGVHCRLLAHSRASNPYPARGSSRLFNINTKHISRGGGGRREAFLSDDSLDPSGSEEKQIRVISFDIGASVY